MDIHNSIMDIHNSIMDIHNSIMDIHYVSCRFWDGLLWVYAFWGMQCLFHFADDVSKFDSLHKKSLRSLSLDLNFIKICYQRLY